jgi:hypothetical protein
LAKILAFFHYLTRCILLKTANSFARFFGENILKSWHWSQGQIKSRETWSPFKIENNTKNWKLENLLSHRRGHDGLRFCLLWADLRHVHDLILLVVGALQSCFLFLKILYCLCLFQL